MTTRTRTVRSPGAPVVRRKTTWFNTHQTVLLSNLSGQVAFDISHPAIVAGYESSGTVVRFIAEVLGTSQAPVGEPVTLGLGVAVISEDAMQVPVTPSPLTDVNQDWYYWWAGTPTLGQDRTERLFSVDIRSARKLRGGYRLSMTWQNFLSEVGTELSVMVRTLWMMP